MAEITSNKPVLWLWICPPQHPGGPLEDIKPTQKPCVLHEHHDLGVFFSLWTWSACCDGRENKFQFIYKCFTGYFQAVRKLRIGGVKENVKYYSCCQRSFNHFLRFPNHCTLNSCVQWKQNNSDCLGFINLEILCMLIFVTLVKTTHFEQKTRKMQTLALLYPVTDLRGTNLDIYAELYMLKPNG